MQNFDPRCHQGFIFEGINRTARYQSTLLPSNDVSSECQSPSHHLAISTFEQVTSVVFGEGVLDVIHLLILAWAASPPLLGGAGFSLPMQASVSPVTTSSPAARVQMGQNSNP